MNSVQSDDTPHTRGGLGLIVGFLGVVVAALIFAVLGSGCQTYKGGNIHDGVNASVGFKLPTSSASCNTFQILWFLNGWVFSWEEDSLVVLRRYSSTHTSFCGLYDSSATNVTELCLKPCGTNAVKFASLDCGCTNGTRCVCGPICNCMPLCTCGPGCSCGSTNAVGRACGCGGTPR